MVTPTTDGRKLRRPSQLSQDQLFKSPVILSTFQSTLEFSYVSCNFKVCFISKDVMYLFMRDTERERQRHRQREKQAPCRKPNVELDPGTPGSRPEPKADAQLLNHLGVSPSPLIISPACFFSLVLSFCRINR